MIDDKQYNMKRMSSALPDTDDLPVYLLAGIFNDKNQSYKLFWFQAILDSVCEGKVVITYEELIHRMVAEAWYMVMEYHLNLGPADALEILINQVRDTSGLLPTAKKEEIIQFLKTSDDKNVKKAKQKLILNVPYRLQSPFLGKLSEKEWRDSKCIEIRAMQDTRMLYYYEQLSGKVRQIRLNEKWVGYLKKNEAILHGWVKNELIHYIQKRNPSVPGIPFKIYPPEKRDLKSAIDFWCAIIKHHDIKDVYTGKIFSLENINDLGQIHIDHFIPWSYIANDEIWNLTPTFAKTNIRKSNQLPNVNSDIELLSKQHYNAYQISKMNKELGKLFDTYIRKNLNDSQLMNRLYSVDVSEKVFTNNMYEIIYPIRQSAKNHGFIEWSNRD